MKSISLICMAIVLFAACGSDPEQKQENKSATSETEISATDPGQDNTAAQTSIKAGDTAAKAATPAAPVIDPAVAAALSWMGVYTGLYPCNQCEGIDVRLKINRDYTYVHQRKHRGSHDPVEFADKGNFTWDSTGTTLTLQSYRGAEPLQFTYTEKKLTQLDENGKKYTGKLAGRFILTK